MEDKTWKNVRKKFEKESLLNFYIDKISIKYSLDSIQKLNIFALINIGIFTKYISSDDIILKNGTIYKIKSLKYDSKNNEFYITAIIKTLSSKNTQNSLSERKKLENNGKRIDILSMWNKYKEYLKKIKIKQERKKNKNKNKK